MRPLLLLLAVPALAVLPGCGGSLDGSVSVAGSSTLLPLMSSAAGTFSVANPLARVDLEMTGTGAGFTALCDGIADIAGASREISEDETARCEAEGKKVVRLLLARDAMVFFTGASNAQPACMTLPDLYALVGPESVGVARWSDAQQLAKSLGSSTSLPRARLVVVSPDSASGTRKLVEDIVVKPSAEKRGQDAAIRQDATRVASDQVMLAEVVRAPTALAFAGYATMRPWEGTVRAIEVDGGKGCVAPKSETIRDSTYPLARSLYIYVNADSLRDDPTVAAFAQQVVGTAAADDEGSVPLGPEAVAATRDALDAATGGDLTGT